MPAHRIMLGFASGLLLTAVSAQSAFAEEYRGTMEQQMACTPDVWRLCSDQIPGVTRITACLRQDTPQLSRGCGAGFQSTNKMPPQQRQQPIPRNRAAPQPRYNNVPPPPPQAQPRPY